MRWSGLCLAAVLLAGNVAHAEGTEQNEVTKQPDAAAKVTPLRRTGAILAAIGPGFFVRGAGSYVAGEKPAAKKLLEVFAIGAGATLLGGAAVGLSGGYPPTLALMPVLLAGGGLLFTSWFADIGVAAGLNNPLGEARAAPPWSVELASLYLRDPFRTAGLLRLTGRIEQGRIGVGASAMIDAENEMRTGDVDVRYRIFGPAPTGRPVADGSRLIVRGGLRSSVVDDDGITLTTGEVEVIGRYDLRRLDRALRGTFVQLSTGIGVERADFTVGHDYNELFLAGFAWGAYLGNRGEAAIFYDHRRDTMIGGLAAWRTAGFVGSVGAYVDFMLDRRIGTRLQIDWGNALVTTVGLRFQGAP